MQSTGAPVAVSIRLKMGCELRGESFSPKTVQAVDMKTTRNYWSKHVTVDYEKLVGVSKIRNTIAWPHHYITTKSH